MVRCPWIVMMPALQAVLIELLLHSGDGNTAATGAGSPVKLPETRHIQSARFERSAASRDSQTIYTTSWTLLKLICGFAGCGPTANKF